MDRQTMKNQNHLNVIRQFTHGERMTRQELAKRLGLSRPTVLKSVDELLEKGVLCESGALASTGGRRAKTLSLNAEGWHVAAIQITRKHVRFALGDLFGEIGDVEKQTLPFRDETEWYAELGERFEAFLGHEGAAPEQVLGIGVSFPGIIDWQAERILDSHVFHIEQVSLDRFAKYLPCPVVVVNDANCACLAEQNQDRAKYFYLSLNESVGGAIVSDHKLVEGSHCRAGEVGHVVIHPGEKMCYCGKAGCADPYLSTGILLEDFDNVEDFFEALSAGDAHAQAVFEQYLEDLAILVSNINMLLDTDIIIGGEVGARIEPYMARFTEKVGALDRFSREIDYLHPCRCKTNSFLKGAAICAAGYFDWRLLK